MSVEKYVSEVKSINWSSSTVYEKLSNFETLNLLFNPENLERAKSAMGKEASKFDIEDFSADRDSCSFKVAPIGRLGMAIVDRESGKTVKITGDGSVPFDLTIWVQLIPQSEYNCKMRLTIHADLNMMMKMMVGKKLKKGVNQIADSIAMIPFGQIPTPESSSDAVEVEGYTEYTAVE